MRKFGDDFLMRPLVPQFESNAWMRRYSRRVRTVEKASLVAYWPMWEPSGAIAYDESGNGRNGAYTAVTLGQPGIGDGRSCPAFDGATSYNNIYSASLAAAFNGAEGTLLIWAKVSAIGIWADGANHFLLKLGVDGTNFIQLYKTVTNGEVRFRYTAGGITKDVVASSLSSTEFMALALTWSKAADQTKGYINGAQVGVTQIALGIWGGALTNGNTVIGAQNTVPVLVWSGGIGHCALWSKALTPAQMAHLGNL